MLDQLRMFLVALEEGSFNRAAVRLRMSQSALSRRMQSLETELGGSLFERTSSGVRATGAGHALAAALPEALSRIDAALAEARRLVRGQRDILRVGYLGSATQEFLNPALAALRKEHPGVKVKLLDLSPGEQIAALRRGEIDLAVTGQEGASAAGEFYTRRLATLPVVAILPQDHRLARRRNLPLAALRGEGFVSSPEADMPGRDRWIAALCRKAGFRPRFVQEGASVGGMFTAVSGDGLVALGPAYLRTYPAAGVVMIPVSDPWARWDFLIVWQRGRASGVLQSLRAALERTVEAACRKSPLASARRG